MHGDGNVWDRARLSLPNENLDHMSDVSNAKNMWNTIVHFLEHRTLLYELAAGEKCYPLTMARSDKVFPCMNSVKPLAGTRKSMNVNVDDKKIAMTVSKGFLPSTNIS